MYKLLFDADALIKLAKISILKKATESFAVEITPEVYEEAVEDGKKKLYPDAEEIDLLTQQKNITILQKKDSEKGELKGYGKGESSLYRVYGKNTIVVTDDVTFTKEIRGEGKRCISSAHILELLYKKQKITKNQALQAIEKLKPYIKKELYTTIKGVIEHE